MHSSMKLLVIHLHFSFWGENVNRRQGWCLQIRGAVQAKRHTSLLCLLTLAIDVAAEDSSVGLTDMPQDKKKSFFFFFFLSWFSSGSKLCLGRTIYLQTNAMSVHSSVSKRFPFVVLLSKSDFAAATSLWNEGIQDLATKIFVDIRGDSLWAMKTIK